MTFQPFLERLERELSIPQPERHQVLRELEAHLEDCYADLVAGGAAPEEARTRALSQLALDGEFLTSISAVHSTRIARALARLPQSVALGLEVLAIGLIGLLLLAAFLQQEVTNMQFIQEGGVFMLLICLAGLVALWLSLERFYSLFLKRDHSPANLGRRLLSLRFLGITTALAGVLGTTLGLYLACSVASQSGEAPTSAEWYNAIRIALSTTVCGLTISLLTLLAHYVIRAKVGRIEGLA